jgi:hypothetical protein
MDLKGRRWEDVDLIYWYNYRNKWKAIVNTAMNLLVKTYTVLDGDEECL